MSTFRQQPQKETCIMTKKSTRKKQAFLLLAAMVMSLLQAPSGIVTAYATGGTDTAEPSVQVYASKDDLMNKFAPEDDGKSDTVGLLYYGKDSAGEEQKWYILGSDDGVGDGVNTVIFAAKKLIKTGIGIKFQSNISYPPRWFDNKYGDYTDSSYIMWRNTEVYNNHYGVSDIRKTLQTMEGEGSAYFSESELKLLQSTKVKTNDYKNKSTGDYSFYTTEDKLYLASSTNRLASNKLIYVGSKSDQAGNGIKLHSSTYWKETSEGGLYSDGFWLRSPVPSSSISESLNELYASPDFGNVGYTRVNVERAVRPASNLNLKDVLFASAADAASSGDGQGGTLETSGTNQDAMILRLDGSGQNIGSAAITDNRIFVKRGSTEKKVSLVVQGRNVSKNTDWYYSKLIEGDGTTVVSTDNIKAALDAEVSIDSAVGASVNLDNCKIWLEIPMGDGSTLSYAVQATKHTHSYDTGKWEAKADEHWHECIAVDCPDPDKGKMDESSHDYGAADKWYYDEEYHYKKCTICESDISIKADTKEAHTFGPDGKCTTCGYDINNDHDLELVDEVEPTCSSVGYESYYRCKDSGCDVKFRSKALGILIRFTDMSEIEISNKSISHTTGTEYLYDSTGHWQICTVCGIKVNEGAHSYSGNSCTVCGYVRKRNSNRDSSSESISEGTLYNGVGGSWERDERGWRFKYLNGKYAAGKESSQEGMSGLEKILWLRTDTGEFPIGADGYLRTAWVCDGTDGRWYYCDENKGKLYGWFYDEDGGYWYYLDLRTGEMLSGWQVIDGKDYYLAPVPEEGTYNYDSEQNRWIRKSDAAYRPYGSMYINATTPDNRRVGADGARTE